MVDSAACLHHPNPPRYGCLAAAGGEFGFAAGATFPGGAFVFWPGAGFDGAEEEAEAEAEAEAEDGAGGGAAGPSWYRMISVTLRLLPLSGWAGSRRLWSANPRT